jgi:hypothetical protein
MCRCLGRETNQVVHCKYKCRSQPLKQSILSLLPSYSNWRLTCTARNKWLLHCVTPACIWMDLTVCYTNSIWFRHTNNRTVGPAGNKHSFSRDTYIREQGGVRVHNALTCFACVFIISHQVETSSIRRSHTALEVQFSIAG